MYPFICLEGVDAVGKTDIAMTLANRLGYSYYKSPGGRFLDVRDIVDEDFDAISRYFFYRAATQNDSRAISELLHSGGVVCDRYIFSTIAFHAAMDAKVLSLFELTQLVMPDAVFLLSAREEVRISRVRMRARSKALESNLVVQRRADLIFRTFGHPVIDTSDTTVDEAANLIVAQLGGAHVTK